MKKRNLIVLLMMLMLSSLSITACDGFMNSDSESSSKEDDEDKEEEEEGEDGEEDKEDKKKKDKKDKEENADEDEKDAKSAETQDLDEDDDNDKETENDTDEKEDLNSDFIASYTGVTEEYEAGDFYADVDSRIEYTLNIIDKKNCELYRYTFFGDSYFLNYYVGKYTDEGDCFKIVYSDGYSDCESFVFIEDGTISRVVDASEYLDEFIDIAGTYSFDSEVGTVEFEVDKTGIVEDSFFVDGEKVDNANLFLYDYDGDDSDLYQERWNLTFSFGDNYSEDKDYYDEGVYCDWFLDFDDDEISYETFNHAIYGDLAGTYKMDGQLGKITVKSDEDGVATASIKIDNVNHDLQGTIGYDSLEEKIYFNLYDEDVSLYLLVDEFDTGDMYIGTLNVSTVLNAG